MNPWKVEAVAEAMAAAVTASEHHRMAWHEVRRVASFFFVLCCRVMASRRHEGMGVEFKLETCRACVDVGLGMNFATPLSLYSDDLREGPLADICYLMPLLR